MHGSHQLQASPRGIGASKQRERERESQRETAGDLSLSRVAEVSAQQPEADETEEGLPASRAQGPHAPS